MKTNIQVEVEIDVDSANDRFCGKDCKFVGLSCGLFSAKLESSFCYGTRISRRCLECYSAKNPNDVPLNVGV